MSLLRRTAPAALLASVLLAGLSLLLAPFVLSSRPAPLSVLPALAPHDALLLTPFALVLHTALALLLTLPALALRSASFAAVALVSGLAAVLEGRFLHRVRFEATALPVTAPLAGPAPSPAGLSALLVAGSLATLAMRARLLALLAAFGAALFPPAVGPLRFPVVALAAAEEAVEPAAIAALAVPVAASVPRAASALVRSLGTPPVSVPVSIGHDVAVGR